MQIHPVCHFQIRAASQVASRTLIASAAALCLFGCRESESPASNNIQANPSGSNASVEATSQIAPAARTAAPPASIQDAANAIDLSRVAVLPGAERPAESSVTSLVYRAAGDVEAAAKHHRSQLSANGWTELPGASITPQYASAIFQKDGFHLSLMVMPGKPGAVDVALRHHGNVALEQLPVPAGAQKIYAGPSSAIFSSDLAVEAAAAEVAKALRAKGWSAYGSAANTAFFKQNAVKVTVMTTSAPAQQGKTTLNFTSEMLPVDVPAPEHATNVEFSNSLERLTFAVKLTANECLDFYRASLGRNGWQLAAERTGELPPTSSVLFRNAANDILELAWKPGVEGELRVAATHRSAARIQEMRRKLEEAQASKSVKLEAGD